MSNSVVPAAAAAHAKQLVRNKKPIKRTADQKPAQDEQQAPDKDDDAVHAIQAKDAVHHQATMSDTSLSADFSFSGALSSAAADSASLAESSAQDDGGSVDDDGDGAGGTVLLVAAVGLVGLGVAVAAGGGGKKNEAPDITSGTTASVAENAAITTVVYTTVATDPDGDPLTYTLSGTDAASFAISSTGVVTLKASADFEAKSSYSFTVTASDGELSDTQNVTVTVTDVTGAGDPPKFTSGTTASIAENSAITTVVYDANVSGTGATFALTGSDASAFNIDSATGVVTFKASPDFEAKSAYAVGVVATQGGVSTTQNVAVTVTNVTEAPTFAAATTTVSVPENIGLSAVAYDANVTSTGATTFALTGADAASFKIDADDGEIRFLTAPDFESAKKSYSVSVVASSGGESSTQAVTINITDVVSEGPTFTSVTTISVPENTAITTVAYDANATGTGTITFGLTGADASLFTIDGNDGEVRFKASPDFEGPKQSYNITVTATDSVGTTSQNVTINVTNVDEPSVITFQLDGFGNPLSDTPAPKNAGDASYAFQEGDGATHVLITNFEDDDVIVLTDADVISRYTFRTGTGADVTDLIIERQTSGGVQSIIVLDDVLTNTTVFNLSTALASVGHEFIVLG